MSFWRLWEQVASEEGEKWDWGIWSVRGGREEEGDAHPKLKSKEGKGKQPASVGGGGSTNGRPVQGTIELARDLDLRRACYDGSGSR